MTVRVFQDLTALVRNKRNCNLVHRPVCFNCHWLKLVGCWQFSIFQRLSFSSLFGRLIDWWLSRTKQPAAVMHCDVPSQRSTTTPRDKSAAVRALPVFLNQTCWFLPHTGMPAAPKARLIQSLEAWCLTTRLGACLQTKPRVPVASTKHYYYSAPPPVKGRGVLWWSCLSVWPHFLAHPV